MGSCQSGMNKVLKCTGDKPGKGHGSRRGSKDSHHGKGHGHGRRGSKGSNDSHPGKGKGRD